MFWKKNGSAIPTNLTIRNYFSFFGKDVYLSSNNGLCVCVKGWVPQQLRCASEDMNPDVPRAIACADFESACITFINLVKELIFYVESGK